MSKPIYDIEDWKLVWYKGREVSYFRLEGNMKSSALDTLEVPVHTSKVLRMVFSQAGQMIPELYPVPYAETENSIYLLGVRWDTEKELREVQDAENRQWHKLNPERMGR